MSKLFIIDSVKFGTGKTTLSIHIAISLAIKYNKKVKLFYWSHDSVLYDLLSANVLCKLELNDLIELIPIEVDSYESLVGLIKENMKEYEYVILDGTGDNIICTEVYQLASSIITPVSDSMLDLYTLISSLDESNNYMPSKYSSIIWKYRIGSFKVNATAPLNWVVVLNKYNLGKSNNRDMVISYLEKITKRFGIKYIKGISNRVIYQSLFTGKENIFLTKKVSLNMVKREFNVFMENLLI